MLKQQIKQLLIPKGRKLRLMRGGIAKGMWMELDLAMQSQRYWGLDERELLTTLRGLIPTCKSLIDIGANDGFYTLAFLNSSAERVVACEPGPPMRQLLRNAAANGYHPGERFTVEQRLIGLGNGQLGVTKLVEDLPCPILLKVDIDGGEFELLESAETSLTLPELRWVIETHSKELEAQCLDWLQSHRYQTRIIYNAPWRKLLPEQRPIPHNRWLLAVPTTA